MDLSWRQEKMIRIIRIILFISSVISASNETTALQIPFVSQPNSALPSKMLQLLNFVMADVTGPLSKNPHFSERVTGVTGVHPQAPPPLLLPLTLTLNPTYSAQLSDSSI